MFPIYINSGHWFFTLKKKILIIKICDFWVVVKYHVREIVSRRKFIVLAVSAKTISLDHTHTCKLACYIILYYGKQVGNLWPKSYMCILFILGVADMTFHHLNGSTVLVVCVKRLWSDLIPRFNDMFPSNILKRWQER